MATPLKTDTLSLKDILLSVAIVEYWYCNAHYSTYP